RWPCTPRPVVDGRVEIGAEKMRARERVMIRNLPEAGVALLVLGAAHDLRGVLPPGAGYAGVQGQGSRRKGNQLRFGAGCNRLRIRPGEAGAPGYRCRAGGP